MDEPVDLKLRLLAGMPIDADGILIYPLKLSEITEIGYSNYAKYVHMYLFGKKEGMTALEIACISNDRLLQKTLVDATRLFTKEEDEVYFSISQQCIYLGKVGGDRFIDNDKFKKIREIIAYQNYVKQLGNTKENPANKKAKEILEKFRKSNEKIENIKKNRGDSDDIDLADIISSVSTKSNSINKFNVWDLTLYQLYDEYRRLITIDQYEINIQSMLHGAKDVGLKHWSNKLE